MRRVFLPIFAAALIAAATGSAQVESFGLRVIVVRTESEARDMPSNWIRISRQPMNGSLLPAMSCIPLWATNKT